MNLFDSLLRRLCRALAAVLLALAIPAAALAQQTAIWAAADNVELPSEFRAPSAFSATRLDLNALAELLADAPQETPRRIPPRLLMPLPLQDGSQTEVVVVQTQLMEATLASQFPEIKTYAFSTGGDSPASGHMVLGPEGIYLAAQTNDGLMIVEPVQTSEGPVYLSFLDFARTDGSKMIDHPDDEHQDTTPRPAIAGQQSQPQLQEAALGFNSGDTLRIFRFTASTTGEFYQARLEPDNPLLNDDFEVVFTLLVDLVGVNTVIEPELAARFMLAANTMSVLYDDPTTDPFEQNDDPMTNDGDPTTSADVEGKPCDLRGENSNNSVILNDADYDLGFLLATQSSSGSAGCAWYNVCLNGAGTLHKSAAAGKVGNNGTNSAAGIILHESGHQLGANHTYSGQAGSCDQPNFAENPPSSAPKGSAYAPGSGTSIMSYNNICGSDNVQTLKGIDVGTVPDGGYYHTASFDHVIDNLTNGGGTCGMLQATSNTAPVVDAGQDYSIPRSTPFTLSGSAVDNEPLTFVWEQYDLATTRRSIDTDDGIGPIIRSIPPGPDANRTIPNLADLLDGTAPRPGEILPSMDRDLNFRLIARDNLMAGGGVAYDGMTITVAGNPFFLTSPNGDETLQAGCPVSVTWVVGGGGIAPTVDLLFSVDGGNNFISTLAADTANDGDQTVTLGCAATNQARAKARAVDNIFFDISDNDFSVELEPPAVTISANGGEVDDSCEFLVQFEAQIVDDCGVNQADVSVSFFPGAANYTLGVPVINKQQTNAQTVDIEGNVLVSDLTNSPAQLAIQVDAQDNCGAPATHQVDIEVADNTPPSISVALDPNNLWPPNHKMRTINATVIAEDNCPGVSFELTSVTSDEPDNGQADGNTVNDIQDADIGTADILLRLRAERSGKGDGRTYTASYTAIDGSNNAVNDSAEVNVDHDKGK